MAVFIGTFVALFAVCVLVDGSSWQGGADGLWDWNMATNEVWFSPRFKDLLGYGEEQLRGTFLTWEERVHPQDQQLAVEAVRRHLEENEPYDCEYRLEVAGGAYRWFRARGVAQRDKEGRPTRMAGSIQDIHERKRAQAELADHLVHLEEAKKVTDRQAGELARQSVELAAARDQALESTRMKSEFLATMSHEIRTPMNGVIGMAGLLLSTELSEEQREYAETIRTSADALLAIINDIVDFSKIEAGRMQFEAVEFDLVETVEAAAELLADRVYSKGVELAVLIPDDVPSALCGDSGRLRQILMNLLGNAAKFTDRGEITLRVETLSETARNVQLKFTVRDSGIGISYKQQRRLFQPFRQADPSTARKYGGTGLGLAISKQLAEMMQGQIGVTSVPGQGSAFWFTLVLEKDPQAAIRAEPDRRLAGRKALVVGDNSASRRFLRLYLESREVIVEEASGGAEALKRLHAAARTRDRFDVVVVDYLMPEMDGIELAHSLKADPELAATPAVLLRPLGRKIDERASRYLAAQTTKPVKKRQFFECINTAVGIARGTSDAVEKPTAAAQAPAESLRVLVAEDNIVNQKVILRMLSKMGHSPDLATNGLEAVGAQKSEPYDLILMDCQMPEMDGYQAAAEIRRLEGGGEHVPIIALTANAMQGDREKCLQAGMDDFITKPIRLKTLAVALARWSKAAAGTEAPAEKSKK